MPERPGNLIDGPALLLQSNAPGGWIPAPVAIGGVLLAAGCALALIAYRRLWSIPPQPRGRLPVDPMLWVVGGFGAYLAGSAGFAASGLVADEAYSRLLTGVLGNLAQAAVALLVMVRLGQDSERAAVRPHRALLAGAAALLLVAPIVAATSIAMNALLVVLGQPVAPATSHETLGILVARRDHLLTALTLAHVALLVPVAEELIWRGLLQAGLRGAAGPRAAVVVTAALFTLVHWPALADDGRATGLAMLLVLACALGILRERTGSTLAPMALHALFNATNVAIALL